MITGSMPTCPGCIAGTGGITLVMPEPFKNAGRDACGPYGRMPALHGREMEAHNFGNRFNGIDMNSDRKRIGWQIEWPEINGTPIRVLPQRLNRIRDVLSRRQPDLTVCMEDIRNEHNVNAILRTCDATGVLYVHYVSRHPLKLTRGVARGAEQWVELIRHATIDEALRDLRKRGCQILATALSDESVDYRRVDYTRPSAIILGNEAAGVSEDVRTAADTLIKIPMFGMVHSLNVSVAAAIILYEAVRQREAAGFYNQIRLSPEEFHRFLRRWALKET